MKEIFLGFAFDEQKAAELLKYSRVGLQTAANQYQMGFISGLAREITVLSVLPVGAFPRGNSRICFGESRGASAFGEIRYLPFVNLLGLKDATQARSVYRALRELLDKSGECIIYVYSLYLPFLSALRRLKREFRGVKICLIVPDLPGKYGILRSALSLGGIRDRVEAKRKMKLASVADSFVLLTETMAEVLPKRPYAVIEGFLPQQEFDYSNKREPKTILYTGSLNAAFGVDKLLDAFAKITDPDFRLWICGAGGIQSTVEECAKKDSRISYFGFLPKKEIAELQTRCDILINPRSADGEYTRYSFPSKTMEYLLSGSKVLMYRLPGVPEEYFKYIYTISGSSADDMAAAITAAAKDEGFDTRRGEQIEWIKREKNNVAQMKKLTELIK